jgi:CRP/FNR family transcriptional regulator, cyclic AMP receptor protein
MTADPVVAKLGSVPLFAELSKRELKALAGKGREVEVRPGTTIVFEGMQGSDFYVILTGTAEVTVDGKPVVTLGPGDYFGELSAITGAPRSATVTAAERLFALRLQTDDLRAFLEEHGQAAYRVLVVALRRLQRAQASPTS